MDIKQWCQLDEQSTSRKLMNATSNTLASSTVVGDDRAACRNENISAQTFIDFFSQPRELFLNALENIADSSTKELELNLYKLGNERIVSSHHYFANAPVNWSTWRQFNSIEEDPNKRKEVFNELFQRHDTFRLLSRSALTEWTESTVDTQIIN